MTDFSQFGMHPTLLAAVTRAGYTTPTPIQAQAYPVIAACQDLIASAQTGTGKTAAFALPILHRLLSMKNTPAKFPSPQVLVLAPTRELALQVHESFQTYGARAGILSVAIYGGVRQFLQVQNLRRLPRVLVATPGRLLDLLDQRLLSLANVQIAVLDEADRMLEMGFKEDLARIVRELPAHRQTLMFSATMPDDIHALSRKILQSPVRIAVDVQATIPTAVEQKIYMVPRTGKMDLLAHLLANGDLSRVLVFTGTRVMANEVASSLEKGSVRARAIHSEKSQRERQRALDAFKAGQVRVLVASDIAARGLDITNISHVVNYDMPENAATYLHRIGRTARAGASGIAISFCNMGERRILKMIEQQQGRRLPTITDHPYYQAPNSASPDRGPNLAKRERVTTGRGKSRFPSSDRNSKPRPGRGRDAYSCR